MPASPHSVHHLRRQWKPHKERLAIERSEHPTAIRFHRACSWIGEIEQMQILRKIPAETSKIDALISKVRGGIDKLREYRTTLISAAVTGKIDVRGEVA
jgi:hypothetical protein